MTVSCLRLCLVTPLLSNSLTHFFDFLELAIQGGITAVQLRDKTLSRNQLVRIAKALHSFLSFRQISLIINDDVALTDEIGAEGVHLGQSDLCPKKARQILGKDKIIGWSVETFSQVQIANQYPLDYIAASAVFPSQSKKDCKTIWGLTGLQKITEHSKHPVIAIGGINHNNVRSVIKNGAHGVAVMSAISQHPQPDIAARALLREIKQGNCHVR